MKIQEEDERVRALLRECAKALRPPPQLTISQWADEYRILSRETSSRPGPWRTSFAPFQREMMDVVTDPRVERVVIKKSSQMGMSEIANNIVGYYIHWDPSPILFLQPTEALAEEYSKDRISPMIRSSAVLKKLIASGRSQKDEDSSNNILHKRFPGGRFIMAGANSPAQLASRSIRILIGDERDRMKPTSEGDAFALAEERTGNFWNRKIIEFSTPTHTGASNIDDAFELTDRRFFYVPCPYCSTFQVLEWKNLQWKSKDGEHYPESAQYACEECRKLIPERYKTKMNASGIWRPSGEFKGSAGFMINALYAPWPNRRWEKLVEKYLKSCRDDNLLQVWTNTTLGKSFRPRGEAPEWERLWERRGPHSSGTAPEGVHFLTAGVDVQRDRIHLEVVGWGVNLRSWSLNYIIIPGDTADEDSEDSPWRKLTDELSKPYPLESGGETHIRMAAIDSGDQTAIVYRYVKQFTSSRVIAVKGYERLESVLELPKKKDIKRKGEREKKLKRGLKVWGVGVSCCKRELYGFLRQTQAGKSEIPYGFCHFPESYEEAYFKELTAEQLSSKIVKGYKVMFWEKLRANEALDCRNYARAAAQLCGVERLRYEDEQKNFAPIVPKFLRSAPAVAPSVASSSERKSNEKPPEPEKREKKQRRKKRIGFNRPNASFWG